MYALAHMWTIETRNCGPGAFGHCRHRETLRTLERRVRAREDLAT